MHKLLLSLSLAVLAFTTAAHADTFNFYATTQSGSVGTGTISRGSDGHADGGQLVFTGGDVAGTYNFTGSEQPFDMTILYFSGKGYSHINLSTNITSFPDGNVCVAATCFLPDGNHTDYNSNIGGDRLVSGSLTLANSAAAATPEPSSLILLGTGILGLAGAARRKFLPRP